MTIVLIIKKDQLLIRSAMSGNDITSFNLTLHAVGTVYVNGNVNIRNIRIFETVSS